MLLYYIVGIAVVTRCALAYRGDQPVEIGDDQLDTAEGKLLQKRFTDMYRPSMLLKQEGLTTPKPAGRVSLTSSLARIGVLLGNLYGEKPRLTSRKQMQQHLLDQISLLTDRRNDYPDLSNSAARDGLGIGGDNSRNLIDSVMGEEDPQEKREVFLRFPLLNFYAGGPMMQKFSTYHKRKKSVTTNLARFGVLLSQVLQNGRPGDLESLELGGTNLNTRFG